MDNRVSALERLTMEQTTKMNEHTTKDVSAMNALQKDVSAIKEILLELKSRIRLPTLEEDSVNKQDSPKNKEVAAGDTEDEEVYG